MKTQLSYEHKHSTTIIQPGLSGGSQAWLWHVPPALPSLEDSMDKEIPVWNTLFQRYRMREKSSNLGSNCALLFASGPVSGPWFILVTSIDKA